MQSEGLYAPDARRESRKREKEKRVRNRTFLSEAITYAVDHTLMEVTLATQEGNYMCTVDLGQLLFYFLKQKEVNDYELVFDSKDVKKYYTGPVKKALRCAGYRVRPQLGSYGLKLCVRW